MTTEALDKACALLLRNAHVDQGVKDARVSAIEMPEKRKGY